MKYLLVVVLMSSAVYAQDQWLKRWEDRVGQSDNPEAKAMDMVSDWVFDHRGGLAGLEPGVLAEGQKIVTWMAEHDIPLPMRAAAEYGKVKTALLNRHLKSKALRAEVVEDDTLAGELLPPPVDFSRGHIPEPINARYP